MNPPPLSDLGPESCSSGTGTKIERILVEWPPRESLPAPAADALEEARPELLTRIARKDAA